MNKIAISLPIFVIGLLSLVAMKSNDPLKNVANGNPVELGTVAWLRDLDEAVKIAKQKKRDVFLLFQEVPG